VKKALKQEEGPDQQTAPSIVLNTIKLKPVSSAYSDDDKVHHHVQYIETYLIMN